MHGFWRKLGAAGRRSHDRRGVIPRVGSRGGPPLIGTLETLEPRVLLNGDAATRTYNLPPPEFFFAAPPPSEIMVGGSTTDHDASGPPAPETRNDPKVSIPPIETSTKYDALSGPVLPALKAQADALREHFRSAAIYLQDAQGNSRSSDEGVLSSATSAEFAPSTAETTMVAKSEEPLIGPPSPQELDSLPKVPWTRSYSYAGAIEADKDSVAFRIPVGPTTQTLTVDVRPGADGQPSTPKIDQLYLVGSHGEMLAAIAGVKFMSNGSEQTLYISIHGAPVGGQLFMRLVRADDAGTYYGGSGDDVDGDSDSSSDVQVPPSWGASNYEISILRTDVVSNSGVTTSATSSDGPSYITTLPATTDPSKPSGASTSYSPGTTSPTTKGAADPQVSEVAQSDEDGVELARLEEETPPVYLGPLVSRTAAPLGPVLATFAGDPAPPVSRADRSTGDALDVLGAELDLDLLLNLRSRRASNHAADSNPDGSTIAESRGGGGAPILLADDQPIDARTEAMALAASLDRDAQPEALLVDAADVPPRERQAEVARAGLATRAVGFLIGLGLASGPLYPDLVALARRKLLRRARPLRRRAVKGGGS